MDYFKRISFFINTLLNFHPTMTPFASITYSKIADVSCPKTKNQAWAGLTKVANVTVQLNFQYEKAVRTGLTKLGLDPDLYVSGGRRNNLEYLKDSKIVMCHKDNDTSFYLWVRHIKTNQETYILNGQTYSKDWLLEQGIIKPKRVAKTQDPILDANGKPVIGFNLKAENVLTFKCGSIEYTR